MLAVAAGLPGTFGFGAASRSGDEQCMYQVFCAAVHLPADLTGATYMDAWRLTALLMTRHHHTLAVHDAGG